MIRSKGSNGHSKAHEARKCNEQSCDDTYDDILVSYLLLFASRILEAEKLWPRDSGVLRLIARQMSPVRHACL